MATLGAAIGPAEAIGLCHEVLEENKHAIIPLEEIRQATYIRNALQCDSSHADLVRKDCRFRDPRQQFVLLVGRSAAHEFAQSRSRRTPRTCLAGLDG